MYNIFFNYLSNIFKKKNNQKKVLLTYPNKGGKILTSMGKYYYNNLKKLNIKFYYKKRTLD